MGRKSRRPAHCEPGSLTNATELGARLRLSRERLAASELATIGSAWRVWAACADATFGYAREADTTYVVVLGNSAGVDRKATSNFLRRFDELGVFVWDAAPAGSRRMSELRLPRLDTRSKRPVNSDETIQSGGSGASLQCNTHEVLRRSYVEGVGSHPGDGASEGPKTSELGNPSAEAGMPRTGPPKPGPQAGPFQEMVASLSIEELQRGALVYGPMVASFYRDELERRAREANPLRAEIERRFGEPVERSFHGDERTGDGIGDDERSQMLWRAAKARIGERLIQPLAYSSAVRESNSKPMTGSSPTTHAS